MTAVVLSWPEVLRAATVGVLRRINGLKHRLPEVYGSPNGAAWDADVVGALAEMAVAKFLGVYWEGALHPQGRDEGDAGAFQVRATTIPAGALILHERDADDARFHLVIVNGATCTLAGWTTGAEGKRPEFWFAKAPRPAFFVPQEALHPVEEGAR